MQIELSNRNADKNSQEKVVNNSFNSETEKGNLTTPIELVNKRINKLINKQINFIMQLKCKILFMF